MKRILVAFLSIIIPFNSEKRFLKDCLDSLKEENLKKANEDPKADTSDDNEGGDDDDKNENE